MIHPQPVVVAVVDAPKKRNPTAKRNAWCESVRRLMLKIYAVDRILRGAKEKKRKARTVSANDPDLRKAKKKKPKIGPFWVRVSRSRSPRTFNHKIARVFFSVCNRPCDLFEF